MSQFIAIDIGNTNTVVALSEPHHTKRIRRVLSMPTGTATPKTIAALLQRLTKRGCSTRAAICSVVPRFNTVWQAQLKAITGQASLLVTHRLQLGVKIQYPRPATIGADRLANICAACLEWGAPVIVADFGTALTLDLVDASRVFSGGLIMPGPRLFLDYLPERTALLPRVTLPRRLPASIPGRNTRAAMATGALLGCRGMFYEALKALQTKAPAAKLCVTGGGAAPVLNGTIYQTAIDPYLTLRGILHILAINQ